MSARAALSAMPWSARLGLALCGTIGLLALFGPSVIPYSPDAIDLSQRLLAPHPAHPFGTDELGRDLMARVAAGAGYSISAALGVVTCSVVLGCLIGASSALAGRWIDVAVMRLMDILLAVPALVLAMALAAALGPGLLNAMIALVVARIPAYVRLARNQALTLRRQGFVEAAGLYGAGPGYIVARHLAPNLAPVLIVQGLTDVGGVILASAALGFIGLGAQPPTPEWGVLASSGRLFFLECWWYAVFPGLAILCATMGFNLVGDWARDRMDPRLTARRTATA